MKVMVSGVMAKALQKAMPNYKITLAKMPLNNYSLCVGDVFRHEEDFDANNNTMKVIKICYPSEYYAMPNYITTYDLVKAYKGSNGTYDGFIQSVVEMTTI